MIKIVLIVAVCAAAAQAQLYSQSRICVLMSKRTCGDSGTPICATDGKTYSNRCSFTQERCRQEGALNMRWTGRCEDGPPTTTAAATISVCSDRYKCPPEDNRSVCGNDGITYNSYCEYLRARCKDTKLRVTVYGPCPGTTTTTDKPLTICDKGFVCEVTKAPVCGSDGKTYVNFCKFRQARCTNPGLYFVQQGQCVVGPTTTAAPHCAAQKVGCMMLIDHASYKTLYNKPYCGSNHVLYKNYCEFQFAACEDSRVKLTASSYCQAATF